MEKTKKIDNQIMQKLDASNVRRLICHTNKGALELCIVKGGAQYYLTLDSVPIEKELNLELMDILFKVETKGVHVPITISAETLPRVMKKMGKSAKK